MALHDVKVPQLSESVAEAALLQWKKQPGEAVEQDEILIEIETDKVVLEVPAPAAGVLSEHVKVNGDMVVSDEVIARIDTDAKASAAPASAKPAAPAMASSASPVPAQPGSTATALPAAAKLMAETGVSLAQGSGKGGRITKGDVLAAQSAQAAAPSVAAAGAPTAAPTAGSTTNSPVPVGVSSLPAVNATIGPEAMLEGRPEQRVPMSRLRARVAERLLQSQASNAILTTFNEVNMAPVIALRKQYVEVFEKEHGVKLGFMSFFVKAAVAALKKYPVLNASVDGNDIVYHGYFDIGIAVGSPRGLVVPIIRNADQLTFAEIEKTISDFGVRAREGKITLEDLTGAPSPFPMEVSLGPCCPRPLLTHPSLPF